MVDFTILEEFGGTKAAIRKMFTCEAPEDPCYKHRKEFEKRIRGRIHSGIEMGLNSDHLYRAADLAWDAAPLVRENIPLLLYAQKKITLERCGSELERLGCASNFVRKDESNKIVDIDLPRFWETSVNLVRSYLTRRIAAQSTRFVNLWPFFKFEPRATDPVGKLRADALSQRLEIMTDDYGYRHLQTQIIRDMFLYTRCVIFPAVAWDREVQWFRQPNAPEFGGSTVKDRVTKEGVDFVRPHPTRIFWDAAYPLSSLNTDNGCSYVGYWDVRRYQDVMLNPAYFNRDRVRISTNGRAIYDAYQLYFDTSASSTCRMRFNTFEQLRKEDPAVANDAKAQWPFYTQVEADETLFVTEYFEKVKPNDVGLGTYPHSVWLRLIVASDDTVIFGEFLPSTPAVYYGYNENDSRMVNISPALEIIPFQDQISNLLSQLLLSAKASAMKLISVDIDALTPEVRNGLKTTLSGRDFYTHPHVVEISGNLIRNVGVNQVDPIRIIEMNGNADINMYFNAIVRLLEILERMMMLSPQELGQPAPHEISATESNEMASSVNTVYGFISDAVDEGRNAQKKLCYESLVTRATCNIDVPVKGRYSDEVVKAAGFELAGPDGTDETDETSQQRVTGSAIQLIHDYTFTSRDGSDRPTNTQSATVLMQLMGQLLSVPGMMQALGKKKLYDIANEIFRLSGAGYDLKLELRPGEEDSIASPEEGAQQDAGATQQLAGQIQQLAAQLEQLTQAQKGDKEQFGALQGQLLEIVKAIQSRPAPTQNFVIPPPQPA
jgi:hypothetical protein